MGIRNLSFAVAILASGALLGVRLVSDKPVAASSKGPSFVAFESGPVRPTAMSADGTTLFVVNTRNATLEILDLTTGPPTLKASVPVGLEPVAVAVRNRSEVWVVNHLSDSVSVVRLGRFAAGGADLAGGRRAARYRLCGQSGARFHHHGASRPTTAGPFTG